MKKRIVLVVGAVVLLVVILGAWIIMSNMRGPGPDWNIQSALFRAMAGNADQVAADNFTNFGEKGKTFLWGSSFDEGTGLQEIIPEVSGGGSTVTQDSTLANTGKSSIKLHADAASGNYAAFYRYGTPGGTISKFGVLFAAWPQVPGSGNDLSHLNIGLNANYWGLGRDILIWSGVKIAREAGGTKKLYYWNTLGGFTDTGIVVDNVFVSRNDISPWQVWHSIKLIINPTVYPPKYDYLEIDGHHFDLSAFTPYYEASGGANWRQGNYISSFISGGTDENVSKDLNVDDVLLSSNEGALISGMAGGGGSVMHNLLDGSVHPDTLAGTPVAGDLIAANATPLWERLPIAGVPDGYVLTKVAGAPAWAPTVGGNPAPETILGNDSTIVTLGPTIVNQEVVLKTIAVPAGTLGVHSHLHIYWMFGVIGSGAVCDLYIRVGGLGGTILCSIRVTTGGGVEMIREMETRTHNKSAVNVQMGLSKAFLDTATPLVIAKISTAINFANAQNIVVTALPGGGTNITAIAYLLYAGYVP